MITLKLILVLLFIGVIATFVSVFILNIAGMVGGLIAVLAKGNNNFLKFLGLLLSALGQMYVYLAYVAFIVNWVRLSIVNANVSWVAWVVAFIAVMGPIWKTLIAAKVEHEENELHTDNIPLIALYYTTAAAFIGFFILAFIPNLIGFLWGWLPYVES